jgi:hypothetical protein
MTTKESDVSDKERELIEKVAKKVADMDLEVPTIIFLQTMKPLSTIAGELGYFFLAPFLPFLEDKGYDFLDTFEQRKNIEGLIRRLESLEKEKSREKEETREPSLWSRIRGKLSPSRKDI